MWEESQKEADSTAAPVKSAPGGRRWDVPGTASEAQAKLSSSKRRWDQDTPQEPDRKKTDSSPLSEADTSTHGEKSSSWRNPGKISVNIGPTAKKTVHSSPVISTSDNQLNNSGPKIEFSMGSKKNKLTPAPIKMSLGVQKPKETPVAIPKTKLSAGAANAFNDDDSDEEEMPPEAKMRMKNIGRETPTAAGPNSFGKGRLGFCDRQKIIQKELERAADDP